MSLVDYASSSDEDESPPSAAREEKEIEPVKGKIPREQQRPGAPASPKKLPLSHNRNLAPPSSKLMEVDSNQLSVLKLPDASLLFDSPTGPFNPLNASDHSSRVAAAMAESATRKRDLKESSSSYPRNKVPKGNLPHSRRSVPDTVDGCLLPPQLAGRSNVVTEDIKKLFVSKPTNSSA